MRKLWFIILTLLILNILILGGCSQKKVAPSTEGAAVSQDQADPKKDDKLITQPKDDARKIPSESITERELSKAESRDIESSIREIQKKLKDVFFEYDRYDLTEDAKAVARELSQILSKNKNIKVIIEGHCDERGTNEYNLGLGDKRAHSVKSYLMSLGIPSKIIETVSYGEEKPVCKENYEACWSKNRRAHFVLIGGEVK